MKNIIILVVVFCFAQFSFGQELPTVIPPTPDVSSLGKFGEYPIATNYGTVPISIPLFELKSGDITVPVSISYHSSGIKVNQEASSVGLGWTLNAGGTISKSVRGVDDRSYERDIHQPNTSFLYDGATTLDQHYNIRPTLTLEDGNHEVFFLDLRIIGLEVDGQSDNYFFNFLNHSGKFVFKGGGTDDILIYPEEQNLKFEFKENVRIDNKPGNGHADGFYTIDDKGFEYWFDDQENVFNNPTYKSATSWNLSRMYSRNTDNYVIFDYEDFDYAKWNYSYHNDYHRTAGYSGLPDFLSPANSSEYFHRLKPSLVEYQTKALKEIKTDNGNGSRLVFEVLNDREDIYASESFFRYKSISLFDRHNQLIKKVTFHHSYFNAKLLGVQNSVNTEEGKKRLRLDAISIAGRNEVTEQTYRFDYHSEPLPHINSLERDYWGYYNGRDPDKILPSTPYTQYEGADLNAHQDKVLAGSLKRIHYPTGGSTEFKFEANEIRASSTSTPVLETLYKNYSRSDICSSNHNQPYFKQLDVAGVVNRSVDVTITFPDIPSNAFGGKHPKDVVTGNFVVVDGAGSRIKADGIGYQRINGVYKHAPIVVKNQTFMNQATGDQDLILTHYRYICDNSGSNAYGPRITIKYDRNYGGSTETYYNAPTGGLRINKITNVDENGSVQIKEYNYNYENENSSGKYVYQDGLPTQAYIGQSYFGGDGTSNPQPHPTTNALVRVFDHSLYDQGISGSIVCYGKVTETITNTFNKPLGKTEYLYHTTQNNRSTPYGFPFAPIKDESHKRTLKSKKVFNTNNDLVSEETFDNTFLPKDEVRQLIYRGTQAFYHPSAPSSRTIAEPEIYINLYRNADHITSGSSNPANHYRISNDVLRKKESARTQYDINGVNPVTTTSNQFYGSSTLMTQSDVLDSRNGRLRTKYYYPKDIVSKSSLSVGDDLTTDEFNEILLLKIRNSSVPIQIENYRSPSHLLEEDDGELLSVQRNIYDGYAYQDVFGNTGSFKLPKIVQTLKGTYNATNNPLLDRVIYHDYDDKGNPIEVSKKDGTKIVYIWGYNQEYPIAKIENASYSQVSPYVANLKTKSNGDNDRTIGNIGKEGALRQDLDALRIALPHALVSTYTYDPLIGVTSMTDPRGYTVYYHYDDFNRLKYIKDADGNLISENKYNYKN